MTYSLDYRKQVLESLEDGMTFADAATFYDISLTTIQKWKLKLHSKTTRNVTPSKISDDALCKDVKGHPDNYYYYERARRFNCNASAICEALRLKISQKTDLRTFKSVSGKRAIYHSKFERFKQQGYPIIYMDESGF